MAPPGRALHSSPMTAPDQSWSHCFACGPAEAHGLQLAYRFTGPDALEAAVTFDARFQGFDGIIHGGILATALDDAMANLACLRGERAVTAELTARFLKPVYVGEAVTLRAHVTRRSRQLLLCEGQVLDPSGSVRAEATGKFIITGPLIAPSAPPAPCRPANAGEGAGG